MDLNFSGKHVLVTGGAMSIGQDIARQFGKSGAMLTIFDYNEKALSKTVKEFSETGYKVNKFLVDVSDYDAVIDCVSKTEAIAPVDILVNNAGICPVTPFLNIERSEWQRVLDVNLSGAFYVAQAVCKYMAKRQTGSVLNMSSKNGLDGEFGHSHYNSSKAGLILLTKTMAIELAHLNINVNAICPGYVRGPMNFEVDSDEFVQEFAERYIPMNRVGKFEDISPIFLFLASDQAKYITGQTFVIDGGQLAGQKPWKELLKQMSSL
jgi:3-oxoacyl-[acyl-carrier protein] reductase